MRNTLTLGVFLSCGMVCGHAGADELIVTSETGIVETIDLDTGETGHRGVCTGSVKSMAVGDGVLYMGGFQGAVFEFDLDENRVTNSFTVSADHASMAWFGDRLLVADSGGALLTVDPATESVEHSVNTGATLLTSVGVDAGGVFVGGLTSLASRAAIGSDDFSVFAACGSQIGAMAFGSRNMYLGGVVFPGAEEGTIYIFDKFVGGVNYSNTFSVPVDPTSMLVYDGLLYIGGRDGTVIEVDPADGSVLRSFDFVLPITGIAPTQGLAACPADYDTSGTLNFFDVATFIDLFAQRLPAGDTNGDGAFDFFDVQRFIDLFNSGCP